MEPSVPLRRELSMTVILISFLAEAVLRCGVDHLAPDNHMGTYLSLKFRSFKFIIT